MLAPCDHGCVSGRGSQEDKRFHGSGLSNQDWVASKKQTGAGERPRGCSWQNMRNIILYECMLAWRLSSIAVGYGESSALTEGNLLRLLQSQRQQ